MLARLRTLTSRTSLVGPGERVGRHRRQPLSQGTHAAPGSRTTVTIVLRDGHELVLDATSSPARSMTQVATLLAHW